jgi:UDP-3-O-[3-hydroxymyristoyl] glucosamine N-acyltransferase
VTLGEIASRVGCPLEGDAAIEIERVAPIDQAGPGDLTFLANPKYASALASTAASAVILGPGIEGAPCAVLRSPNPYLTFAKVVGVLTPDVRPAPGIDPSASVGSGSVLGEEVSVGPFAVVGPGAVVGARTIVHPHVVIGPSATIGPDCVLHAHVSIRERSVIGARVVLQDGVVIGSDGFGFAPRDDGSHEKIPQTARVVIEDDVEIGANTTIDRPAIGETRIKAGAKIDNLVQIAHGVVVGRNTLLAAQVGIAGSTVLGDNVTLAGQVGVAGHITVGDRVRAVGQSGITRSVPPDAFVSGYPAIDNLEWRKASAAFRRLPELRKRISRLERRLARLDDDAGD